MSNHILFLLLIFCALYFFLNISCNNYKTATSVWQQVFNNKPGLKNNIFHAEYSESMANLIS